MTLDETLDAAARAARSWARADRAAALEKIADEIDAAADELVPIAHEETHIAEARLRGEVARTTFQLRFLAKEVRPRAVVDEADPRWLPAPRPKLVLARRPIGPVLVFAASNFPFAFSVAGGDTASALAAGCPVVLKAHPGHPRLSAATAEIVRAALPEGVFAVIHSEEDGRAALTDPRIRAAAFTGSPTAGRALYDLAVSRPEPIPFYGELGSVNPVFVTEAAARARGAEIAAAYVDSFTMAAGQLCTKPGLFVVPAGSGLGELAAERVRQVTAAPLLNDRIAGGYAATLGKLVGHEEVRTLVDGGDAPTLLATTAAAVLKYGEALRTECFGPASLVVEYSSESEMLDVVRSLDGQLTGTVQAEAADPVAAELVDELAEHVGRVVWNGWPTGVAVTHAMHHGGPYPATTAPLHTSVGAAAVERFLRPVAFQDVPEELLGF
ncbi:aldehyde dehydrogenase (NADP(+)) [Amycolatopsis thermalba]|uniref:Aldehyde dehydrogenase (NADP(+)) n=1 Tax=Amycolatopsis thermalba TaxID=944492 RepID=A0ABY4NM60_9PSEU|nr:MULTISPECIES: aldehyde dehydrogenase (NADP(+)) [Amycolatopsis]OXM61047.1 aldehyde dehydrogenase (NADP(+)) [Amycolatopsis sp. KNN50.9b]UQS21554.1 aldehyde dehydrogenase (NADP(+)) [Amycolatopsis thermalba]